jgi:3-oxoacyl-[acyl-carrier-protein] synthase II
MMSASIGVECAVSNRPGVDGFLTDSLLVKERRSKKVGALPDKARMVLAAAHRCLRPNSASTVGARDRVGVSLGTLFGSMDVAELCLQTAHDGGFGNVTPSWYATGLPNSTAAIVASVHDMKGPNLTVLGYQAGVEAIIMGCRQILAGRASAMLAGGFDLASERYTAQLREAADYSEALAIHPGVGLVWLSENGEAASGTARIVGWSQGIPEEGAFKTGGFSRLIESASKGRGPSHEPVVHIVYPGRKGAVDHMAATAPIYLVENIVEAGPPGLHALIVKGFGPSVVCLLVEKSPH